MKTFFATVMMMLAAVGVAFQASCQLPQQVTRVAVRGEVSMRFGKRDVSELFDCYKLLCL